MAHDRPPLTLEQMHRLLDDIESIPQQPVGPHLEPEDLIGFAKQSLSTSRHAAVLEHVRSCARCAQDVLDTPDVLAAAITGRRLAAEKRLARARPARDEIGPRLRQLAWFMVATAVLVAARRMPIRARAAIRARGTDVRQASKAGGFKCAIGGKGKARIVAVRTLDRRWTAKPIRCVIHAEGGAATDVWLIIPAKSTGDAPYIGTALLPATISKLSKWTADLEVFESYGRLPRDPVDILRRAYDEAGGDVERKAWKQWLEQQVREGEVTSDLVKMVEQAARTTEEGLINLLTPREKSILRRIAQGKTTKEMAREMGIAIKTVETQRSNICRKLQIEGRQALAKFAALHRRDI